MQVSEIKKIGKGMRYSLYVDDKFEGVIESEVLARFSLKTGQEVDEKTLQKLKIENGDYACFDKALGLLEHGQKTQKQVKDYLKDKGYPGECIVRAMEKLTEYGYLDDMSYARNFVNIYSNSRGVKRLRCDLLSKGVSREIIDSVIETLDEEDQLEACKKLYLKKTKGQKLDKKEEQKVMAYLAGKGFDFDVIRHCVREENDDWD